MEDLEKVEACVGCTAQIHGPMLQLANQDLHGATQQAETPQAPPPPPSPPPFPPSIATMTAAVEFLQEENRTLVSRLEVVEEDNRTLVSRLEVAELGYGAAMVELRERVSILGKSGFHMIDASPVGQQILF